MNANQIISSCRVLIDHTTDSPYFKLYLVFLFVVFPILKIFLSHAKTQKKVEILCRDCSSKIPKKLLDLVILHKIDTNKIYISCSDDFVAVTTGFINKKIIFSKHFIKKFTSKELESVLLHEVYHYNNNHSIILILGEIITGTLFFLPSLQDIFQNIKIEFERNADMAAVKYQKTTKFVKTALLKVVSNKTKIGIYPQFAYQVLDQRLDNLNSQKKKYFISKTKAFVSFFSVFIFLIIIHFNAKYAMADKLETSISCSLFECVQNCVQTELFNKAEPMSKINFSMEIE